MKYLDLIIIYFMFLIGVNSCTAQTTYTIKQGSHFSSPRQFASHTNVSAMERTVTFDSSCIYFLGNEDDSDINKLFGWGVGLTSANSIRIGWNCKSGYAIDLYAYVHLNGKRWIIPRDSIIQGSGQLIGRGFKTGLPISCGIYRARDSIVIEATQEGITRRYSFRCSGFPGGWGF